MDAETEARMRSLIDGLESRDLTVPLFKSMERRLFAQIDRINSENVTGERYRHVDDDLVTTLLACAERGLEGGERDAGLYADIGGHVHGLPRPVRASWRNRLRFAWRAAVTTWRAT